MRSDKTRALIIFARTPLRGAVKKRLAQSIGATPALNCYKLLLKKVIKQSTNVTADRFLYFYPHKIETLPGDNQPLAAHFSIRRQKSAATLGAKMATAFTEILQEDNFKTAVLIGSDIPFLHTEIIEQAFLKLAAADIVLGPALDGGYYLIGRQHRALNQAEIFRNIPWGTDQVFKATVDRARAAGLSVATLPPLFDVDTLADLKKWQQQETDPAIAIQLNEILLAY